MSRTAIEAMLPYLDKIYGNPSSLHSAGQEAKEALEAARADVARCLGAQPNEIYFTSCGSESDNQAIRSAAHLGAQKGKKHIVSTAFEHHAVLHTLERLKKEEGFEVTLLDVHSSGVVSAEEVRAAIRPDTCLVTVMFANNEIGTVQPIAEIGAVCREAGVLFHTDAVQAVGHIPVDVVGQNIDMLSLSAHKFHGPKGVGALYCRKGVRLLPFIDGGAQERGRRAGTENIAGIAAMAAALKEACAGMRENAAKLTALRDKIVAGFEGIEGEGLLLHLDDRGVCASSGSACTSGSLEPSHVLLAIGLPHEVAHGSLRLSLSEYNTEEDADRIIAAVPEVVEYLRNMSPVWKEMERGEMKHLI